jgi:hypothetical protein
MMTCLFKSHLHGADLQQKKGGGMTQTMTKSQYAVHIGKSKQYISQLVRNGRVVQNPAGLIKVEESDALMAELADPSKQGVVERHAEARDTPAEPMLDKAGSAYQQARAMREKYNAMSAKIAYEKEIKTLISVEEVIFAIASGDAVIRQRLESLPDVLSPQLAAEPDEQRVRSLLIDYIEALLTNLSGAFNKLVKV